LKEASLTVLTTAAAFQGRGKPKEEGAQSATIAGCSDAVYEH
jgi:hypothetical protein